MKGPVWRWVDGPQFSWVDRPQFSWVDRPQFSSLLEDDPFCNLVGEDFPLEWERAGERTGEEGESAPYVDPAAVSFLMDLFLKSYKCGEIGPVLLGWVAELFQQLLHAKDSKEVLRILGRARQTAGKPPQSVPDPVQWALSDDTRVAERVRQYLAAHPASGTGAGAARKRSAEQAYRRIGRQLGLSSNQVRRACERSDRTRESIDRLLNGPEMRLTMCKAAKLLYVARMMRCILLAARRD